MSADFRAGLNPSADGRDGAPPIAASSDAVASERRPRHIAVVMDGNGRWAERRRLSRYAGHRRGLEAARELVFACAEYGIPRLTLFAFSSENWRRPPEEVHTLLSLMADSLLTHAGELRKNGARLRFIGERTPFPPALRRAMEKAEAASAAEAVDAAPGKIALDIAVNYGGRWDIVQAARRLIADNIPADAIDESAFAARLSAAPAADPDLLIRTGGEMRLSNFLLWQAAYSELYFSETLWPDFCRADLDGALAAFAARERRFGMTGAQIAAAG